MDVLQQLEMYTSAQKSVGGQFMLIGTGLLILSGMAHFFGEGALANGLKIGGMGCALLILA